jgi:hypothetical protein
MGLLECAECGREISSQALSCPGCGAPPEAFASVEIPATSVPESQLAAATHTDGRSLIYDVDTREFALSGVRLSLADVFALDKKRLLRWTRLDVRSLMQQAVKRSAPMADLPTDPGPSVMEKVSGGLDKFARAVEPLAGGNAAIICPHCQSRGTVRTKQVKRKKGVSGGKATAAVLTGGLSVLATGLSRKETVTEAHCTNCRNTWQF